MKYKFWKRFKAIKLDDSKYQENEYRQGTGCDKGLNPASLQHKEIKEKRRNHKRRLGRSTNQSVVRYKENQVCGVLKPNKGSISKSYQLCQMLMINRLATMQTEVDHDILHCRDI